MNVTLLAALVLIAQNPRDTVVLGPVVVTATGVPTPAPAVTAAVTVITGASLRARGIRTVAEALRETLGATIVQTAGYGTQTALFLRGGESDYVKVLLDGVSLNQPGGAYNLAHLTTDDVERIEIVRGPASVLYGSDAVAGVVQIFTRTGVSWRTDADVEGGTRSASRLSLGATGRGSGVAYSIGLSRFATDGLFPLNSRYRNSTVTGRIRVPPDAHTDASLTVRHEDAVLHYPTDGAGNVVDANQFATDRGPTLGLEARRRVSSRLEVRALAGWRDTDSRLVDDPDNAADTTGVYRFHSRDRVRRLSAELRVTWLAGGATTVTGGVAIADDRLRSTNACTGNFGTGPLDCSSPPMDTTRATRGYFVQVQGGGRAGQPVSVNVGTRVERNEQFGTFTTWRAGAAWRLDDATRLRAAAGTAFKEPTLFENFAIGFVIGNPDLKPERSFSWDAGLEHAIPGTALSAAVTYFDQRFRDVIVYDFSRIPNYVNVADARTNGAEVRLDYAGRGAVSASLSYTYLESRVLNGGGDPTFETGKRLIRRPGNTAALEVAFTPPAGRGSATLAVRFVGDRDDLDFSTFPATRVTLHPCTRVDAAAEFDVVRAARAGHPELTLLARVQNLFDDRGREIAGFPSAGRVAFLGGRVSVGR